MRGRKAQVRYYASKGAYFTIFRGVTHKLAEGPDDAPTGATYTHALKQYLQIMSDANAPQAKDENTLGTVVGLYLEWVRSHRREGTHRLRSRLLTPFLKHQVNGRAIGDLRVNEISPSVVEHYLAHQKRPRPHAAHGAPRSWGDQAVANFLESLQAAMNWAVKSKPPLITSNPAAGIERPARQSRGAEALMAPDLHAALMGAAEPDLQELLIVARRTGCRPGELYRAEAKHFDVRRGAIVYHAKSRLRKGDVAHKTAGKGKDRVIYLVDEALDLVRQLVIRNPSGPLFRAWSYRRGRRHAGWTPEKVNARLRRLKAKHGVPESFTLYAYRHTFATNWLLEERSIDTLAVLLGNSVKIIRHHYSHLCDHPEALRQELVSFVAEQPAHTPPPLAP